MEHFKLGHLDVQYSTLPDHREERVSAGDLGHPAELAAVAGGLAQPQQGEVAAPALDALQAGLRHGLL